MSKNEEIIKISDLLKKKIILSLWQIGLIFLSGIVLGVILK